MKPNKLARQRMQETGPPDLNCKHDAAYFLHPGVPLRYCPSCHFLSTGVFGKYSIYMHPDMLGDLARIEAKCPEFWVDLVQALAAIGTKGPKAGEPL